MNNLQNNSNSTKSLATSVQHSLLNGELHMKHIIGLTDAEINACVNIAKHAAADGSIEEAQSVFSLILANDPTHAVVWSEYTLFLERYRPDAPQLDTCRLATECLDTNESTPFSTYRSVAAQESTLKKWAQKKSGNKKIAH